MNQESRIIYDYTINMIEGLNEELVLKTNNLSERCIEVPWVAQSIKKYTPKRMLDIGISLASLDYLGTLLYIKKKYDIYLEAVDIIQPQRVNNRYPIDWVDEIYEIPFLHGDIRELDFGKKTFDMISCISVIEHIGFDEESELGEMSAFKRSKNENEVREVRESNTNHIVLNKFAELLNKNGKLLLSVPMGKGGSVLLKDSLGLFTRQWEYEKNSWNEIIENPNFRMIEQKFYKMKNKQYWEEVDSPKDLIDCSSSLSPHAFGCALGVFDKK